MKHQEHVDNLIEDIGLFIEYWGFRKIHGKIWALLYITSRPLSTPEIVKRLNISKALASGALKELAQVELIEKVGQVKFGGITYQVKDHPAETVRNVLKNREIILLKRIQENLSQISSIPKETLKNSQVDLKSITQLTKLVRGHHEILNNFVHQNIKTIKQWTSLIQKFKRFKG